MYNKRVWVNPEDSPSTGYILAYHGPAHWVASKDGERRLESFFEVAYCQQKARLNKCNFDSMDEFIQKIEMVRDAAAEFAFYLKNNKE
jgi:hypothetical protein